MMAVKIHFLALVLLTLTPQGHQQAAPLIPTSTSQTHSSTSAVSLTSGSVKNVPGLSSSINSTAANSSETVVNVVTNKTDQLDGQGAITSTAANNSSENTINFVSSSRTTNILVSPNTTTDTKLRTKSTASVGNDETSSQLPQWMVALLQGAKPYILSALGVGANATQSQQLPAGLSGMMQGINPDALNKIIATLGIGSNFTGQSQPGNLASGLVKRAISDLSGLLSMFGMGASSSQGMVAIAQQVFSALEGVGQAVSDHSLSPPCRDDLSSFITALQSAQLWALQMLDAMGKPRAGLLKGQLTLVGDYDECLSISHHPSPNYVIQGQFCRLKVETDFLRLRGLAMLYAELNPVMVHICVPRSCSSTDLHNVLQPAFNATKGLGKLAEPPACDLGLRDPTEDAAFWAAICITTFLALLCGVGTLYGEVLDRRVAADRLAKLTVLDSKNGDVNGRVNAGFANGGEDGLTSVVEIDGTTTAARDMSGVHVFTHVANGKISGTCCRLLASFSVLKNGRKLLSCGQTQWELSCLHGLRVLSITWVMLGHAFMMELSAGPGLLANPPDMYKFISRWSNSVIYAGALSVDTFFLLSGCLTCYLFLRQTKKAGGITCFHMVMYYVHRFWRLTPLYMFILIAYVGITPYIQSGPFAFDFTDHDNCRKYWWQNLLYFNNLVSSDKQCMGWSWYLSDNMQFYWIAPMVLVPLALGYRAVGLVLGGLLVLCQIVTVNVISRAEGTHAYLENAMRYQEKLLFPPWCRVGPFAIGLMLGYALHAYDCTFRMRRISVTLGWLVAVGAGLMCVYITHDDVKDILRSFWPRGKWNVEEAGLYEAFSRPLWACAVAWVVWACSTGYGGFVNTLLSWKAWAPLSRLTYGVYLVHLIIALVMMHNRTEPFYLSSWSVVEVFLDFTVLSFMISFVTSLLVELPSLGVEKILLGGSIRKRKN